MRHKFAAYYRSGTTRIETRQYDSPGAAWAALERALLRRGINPGPWHMPGVVSGDCLEGGRITGGTVSRANGGAGIQESR